MLKNLSRRNLRWLVLGVVGLSVGVALASNWLAWRAVCRDFRQGKVQVGEHVFQVAYARTPAEHAQGLAGCAALPASSGMYFVFADQRLPSFWMRGMLIPLDMVWIARGQVVGVTANVPALADPLDPNPPRYAPPQPVDAVLEIGAGQAARAGITAGSAVREPAPLN